MLFYYFAMSEIKKLVVLELTSFSGWRTPRTILDRTNIINEFIFGSKKNICSNFQSLSSQDFSVSVLFWTFLNITYKKYEIG